LLIGLLGSAPALGVLFLKYYKLTFEDLNEFAQNLPLLPSFSLIKIWIALL
jgi:hypothetical protein